MYDAHNGTRISDVPRAATCDATWSSWHGRGCACLLRPNQPIQGEYAVCRNGGGGLGAAACLCSQSGTRRRVCVAGPWLRQQRIKCFQTLVQDDLVSFLCVCLLSDLLINSIACCCCHKGISGGRETICRFTLQPLWGDSRGGSSISPRSCVSKHFNRISGGILEKETIILRENNSSFFYCAWAVVLVREGPAQAAPPIKAR